MRKNRSKMIAGIMAVSLIISTISQVAAGAETMDAPNLPNTGEASEYDAPNIPNTADSSSTTEYDSPNLPNNVQQDSKGDAPTGTETAKLPEFDKNVKIPKPVNNKKASYFVSFYYNYGNECNTGTDIDKRIMPTVSLNEADYTLPYCEYTRDGYVFSGWSTDRAGTEIIPYGNSLRLTAGEKSLYAQWKQRDKISKYTVRFDANGGSGTMSSVTSTGGSIAYPENGFIREGYAFLGWGVGPKVTETSDSDHFFKAGAAGIYLSSETTTLYAIWKKTALKYGDIVAANGYTNDMNKSLSYNKILRRIRIKESSGKIVTVSMNLRLAKAAKYNGTGHQYKKNKNESPVVDINNSKVYVNGTKVKISRLVVKNGTNAWVSQSSVFAPLISSENMEKYAAVPLKKQPVYYLQLQSLEGASKSTKKAVKYLNRYFKQNPTAFEIVPIQLGKESIKTATIAKGGTKIKKLVTGSVKKNLKENKDGKKDYILVSIENGVAKLQGTNNYNGTIKVKLK